MALKGDACWRAALKCHLRLRAMTFLQKHDTSGDDSSSTEGTDVLKIVDCVKPNADSPAKGLRQCGAWASWRTFWVAWR